MAAREIFVSAVFSVGPFTITNTVVTTWAIMLALAALAWCGTRSLRRDAGRFQVAIEGAVGAMEAAIAQVLPDQARRVLPFVGTLWVFILAANLSSLLPGVRSPTGDFSLTAGLALLVFLAVHFYGVRTHGLRAYLGHYLKPNPVLLPFHVVSEISRTLALAVRLFGNMFSLQMAAMLVLALAGFLAPVPILLLHVIEALVQAYIFGTLALIYVAGAIQAQEAMLQVPDKE